MATAALVVLGVASGGCARRAPGPEECHELAATWVLEERGSVAAFGGDTADEAVLERTTECLTIPYDRELVQCVTSGGAPRGCYRAFLSRRTESGGTIPVQLRP